MADIRYQFVATGANAVLRDWQSLTAAAQKYAAEINKLHKAEGAVLYGSGGAAGGGYAGASAARRGGASAGMEATRAARDAERNRAYLAKIRDKYFADEQRAEERAAAKKIRTEEQALARIERMRAAARAKEIRETERAEKQRVAVAEKARIAESKRSAMARDSMAGSVFRGVGGVAMGLAAAGIGVSVQATRDAMRVQELANRVSINARKSGQDFLDPNVLRKEWEKTAQQSPGIKAEEVGQAVQRYIAMTGDIETARQNQGTFATVASAGGASIESVAATAASIADKFKVTSQADMRDVLSSLVFQGKEGAFEMSDAAQYFQEMASAGASFGMGKGVESVKTLGGLAQIARAEVGSGAEASTAVQRMFSQLKMKTGELASGKFGGKVSLYDDQGNTRNITELLPEIIAKVGGSDVAKKNTGLQKIFDTEGFKAIAPLSRAYNEAYRDTKGSDKVRMEAGMAAVSAAISKATNATGTWADVQKDAARAQQNSSAKLTAAWEKVVAMAGEEIVPALMPMVDELTKWTGAIRPAVEAVGFFVAAMRNALELLGFIGPKTPEEKLADKKQQLEAMDADLKANPLPFGTTASQYKAQDEKRKKLVEDIAKETAATTLTGAEATKKFRSFSDFSNTLKSSGGIEGPVKDEDLQRLYDQAAFGSPEQTQQLLSADAFPFLTNKGQTQAGLLANQAQEAKAGKGEMPAGFYEAENLVPAFAGLGEAADALKKVLLSAAEAKQADLLGG